MVRFFIISLFLLIANCSESRFTETNLAVENVEATENLPKYVYRLGSGDKIRVIVFGEDEMSGEFEVGNNGGISLPYIQDVQATGLEGAELEKKIADRYIQEGILKNPKVSVEILEYRPFYIHGEVNQGGEFPYKSGMDIRNAVAVAGGYTYRAATDVVLIRREGSSKVFKIKLSKGNSVSIYPGDNIEIPERFF